MILQPCNVELTKIHYYDKAKQERNLSVSTISREVCQNNFNKNVIIKKNVFGHRWVLKINETQGKVSKGRIKLVVYVLVFCSIIIAVCFGIFLSVVDSTLCANCSQLDEVCLKIEENQKPKCVKIVDRNDPTGCGGLCPINTHFCHILDFGVYQCSVLTNTLKCPTGNFSCGNRCISMRFRCDGMIHCSNYADETNCVCDLETHFHCGNTTSCLEKSKKCDEKVDCWDRYDEMSCNTGLGCIDGEIPCQNGQCIQRNGFCDGKPDCLDESDEPEGCRS